MTRLCEFNGYLYHSGFKITAGKKDEFGRTTKILQTKNCDIILKTYIQEIDDEGHDCVFYFEYKFLDDEAKKLLNRLIEKLKKFPNVCVAKENLSIDILDDLPQEVIDRINALPEE